MEKLDYLQQLAIALQRLPGVGPKTSLRYAFHIIQKWSSEEVDQFSVILKRATENVRKCVICNMMTTSSKCEICCDETRDNSKILVVKDPREVFSMERTKQYNGLYHVLGGNISLPDGIGPDDLAIDSLIPRLVSPVNEVILATGLTPQGEVTSHYLIKYLDRYVRANGIVMSRIGYGLPAGSELEYADELTLKKALEARK